MWDPFIEAYAGCSFCVTFLFLLWVRPFFPPTVSSYWVGGWVFLRWRSEKVIPKLVPPLVFWHCTKRFPMFPGIFLPCQIKYTNSTSLLSSAALLTKKKKRNPQLLYWAWVFSICFLEEQKWDFSTFCHNKHKYQLFVLPEKMYHECHSFLQVLFPVHLKNLTGQLCRVADVCGQTFNLKAEVL